MNFPVNFISAGHEFATFERQVPAPYLRKTFTLAQKPEKAELLICGLGFYELYVNGKNVTKGPLAPYISNPNQRCYYDSYEISAYLNEGENVIGAVLGNGMLNCFGGYIWDFEKAAWRDAPKLALCCEITVNKDAIVKIESDEGFKTHASPTYFDELRVGEFYDARKELPGWAAPGFDDSSWAQALPATRPAGKPALCKAEPIVITHTLTPVSVTPCKDGYLYDFGINCAGVPKMTINGAAGQEISLEHGERLLEDGSLDLKNIQFVPDEYVQRDRYICSGKGEETFVPRFTYHGFQYIYVTGITPAQATPALLTYLVMNTDLEERGSFSCSDEMANTLQTLTRRSTLANFYYFPTDCPHREKNGWTGDAALSAEHTLLNLSAEESYKEWLRNVCAAQAGDGGLPCIVPTGTWGEWGCGPAWDCALTYLPYYTYRYRGDMEILMENAPHILHYLGFIEGKRDEKGLIHYGLGDWCPPDRGAEDYVSPLEFSDSVMAMDICRKAEQIFAVLGRPLHEQYAKTLGDQLKAAVRKHLIDFGSMTAAGSCQTSQSMAIYYGLFEEGEKPLAAERLVEMIHEKDGHFDTGILGARVIFHVLSNYGYGDLAFHMIVREDFPSYGNWVARGATSLWEDFHKPGDKVNSLNHHFFGDISAWFIKRVAGIVINPNFTDGNEVRIKPCFISNLAHAKAHCQTPSGRVECAWERRGDTICVTLTLPEAMHGKLIADKGWRFADGLGEIPAKSGEYTLVRR